MRLMVGRLGLAILATAAAVAAAGNAAAGGSAAPAAQVIPGCNYRPQAMLTPGEGRPDPARALAASGTLRVAMLFIAPGGVQPAESPADLYAELAPPTQRWFQTASYGRARLEVTALKTWLRAEDATVAAAVDAAAGQLDLSRYDAVAAVLPEETRGSASHAEIVPAGPIRFGVVLAPHPTATTERAPQLWTVLAHELGHVLGLPDLYVTAGNGAESLYAGPWDPMSQPLGQNLLAWHAWSLGWIDSANVACVFTGTREATLTPLERPGGLKALLLPQGGQSVIVVEARTKTGLDANLCAEGILVYTVQIDAVPRASPVRVLGKNTGSGACGPLSNAPLKPGDSLKVGTTRIDVLAGLRVRVTR
jgi:M6 family metalloprotease-like protein